MNESKTAPTKSDRRDFLKYLTAAAAGVATGFAAGSYVRPQTQVLQENRTETVTLAKTETVTETFVYLPSLRAAAEARGMLIGSEVDTTTLNDSQFADILIREFNAVTPDGMTWSSIDRSGYGSADAIVKFASTHHMKVKGHPLVWHGRCARLD